MPKQQGRKPTEAEKKAIQRCPRCVDKVCDGNFEWWYKKAKYYKVCIDCRNVMENNKIKKEEKEERKKILKKELKELRTELQNGSYLNNDDISKMVEYKQFKQNSQLIGDIIVAELEKVENDTRQQIQDAYDMIDKDNQLRMSVIRRVNNRKMNTGLTLFMKGMDTCEEQLEAYC
jgi:hypothetical protein